MCFLELKVWCFDSAAFRRHVLSQPKKNGPLKEAGSAFSQSILTGHATGTSGEVVVALFWEFVENLPGRDVKGVLLGKGFSDSQCSTGDLWENLSGEQFS